jgi:uncharacterized membrane protein
MSFTMLVEAVVAVIDLAAVVVIAAGLVIVSLDAARRLARHEPGVYTGFRQRLGRIILLGLELLVAADIIRTVAIRPSVESLAVLALLVLVRTFLSFAIEVEITGRWPWQARDASRDRAPS